MPIILLFIAIFVLIFVFNILEFIFKLIEFVGDLIEGLFRVLGVVFGALGAVGLVLLAVGLVWAICHWLYYYHTKKGIKMRKDREREEKEAAAKALIAEAKRSKAEQDRFGRVLEQLKAYMIIVDTNVFMDAAEGSNTASEAVLQSNRFFRGIVAHRIKVHVLVSQLNELQHLKKGDDQAKQYKARCAQRIIEELQRLQIADLYGDPNANERYADAEIIKVVRKLARLERKPLVITNDRDLTIRLRSIDRDICRAVSDLYKGDTIF